eukprot:1194600-Prorocentrum_minimum.AAC.1
MLDAARPAAAVGVLEQLMGSDRTYPGMVDLMVHAHARARRCGDGPAVFKYEASNNKICFTRTNWKIIVRVLYLYLGEWNPRVWDMSEVYNPMYRDTRLVLNQKELLLRFTGPPVPITAR